MAQRWRRLGRLLGPEDLGAPWSTSHASCPTALPLDGDLVRVFFSTRDAENRAHLGSVDFAIRDEAIERAGVPRGPLLRPGQRGAFDADGVTVSAFVRDGARLLAFYLGWSRGANVPFTNFIGIAVGDRDGTVFDKPLVAPIVGRSEVNPFSVSYPSVARIGSVWRMWFGTHLAWGAEGLEMAHVIRTALSRDGFTWEAAPGIAVDLNGARDPDEFAVARPFVVPEPQAYSMWYCRRHARYRLGYAVSADGETWERRDEEVTFAGVAGAWDASEAAYPCVFDHLGRRYLLYNGDGFGRTGFGIAVLE